MKKETKLLMEHTTVLSKSEMQLVLGGNTVRCPPFDPEMPPIRLPNPWDCSSFFQCNEFGQPVLIYCPPGSEV